MAKAKAYSVTIGGNTHLAYGLTRQSALTNTLEHLEGAGALKIEMASGEELYAAGKAGTEIIGEDKYKQVADPNRQPLPIDDTDTAGA